jgi:glycosyltransferase involved in cell wall biosynthesis
MRIGVDATCWNNNRGYGRHARALLHALTEIDSSNEYTLFFDSPELTSPPPRQCLSRYVETSASAADTASAKGQRSLADLRAMSRALAAGKFDVLVFPTVYTYVPVFSAAKKIVFLHDVIAETFPHLTLPRWSGRQFWRAKVAAARFQADAIVTVSDYSKQHIIEHFGTRPEKVFVVGEAADDVFRHLESPQMTSALQKCGISADAQKVVYVGGFSPHKNLPALIDAFARVARNRLRKPLQLVLVGEYRKEVFHSEYSEIRAQVERLGIANRTVFTGYLPDEDVAVLLNLSDVLVLPSLMEGYGLPAVEAAACGCPVIATNESPLAGLLGDGAITIAPNRDAIEPALKQVLDSDDVRKRMQLAGLKAVRALTWYRAAEEMIGVLNKLTAHTEVEGLPLRNRAGS